MGMGEAVPYAGMVISQIAQVGLMIAGKVAMANGMTTFAFIFYSNLMASLLLLPICFSLYRSAHPPLFPTFLYGFFLLGFIGFMVQLIGYTGLLFASAALSTTILNLIPAFTFLLAVILRMEKFDYRSYTTVAKCIGTIFSIVGATIATLYQGPTILGTVTPTTATLAAASSSAFFIGGLLFTLDSAIAALFMIAQAVVIKKYPAELILMLFYSIFIAILSAGASLIVEKDLSAWSLNSATKLIPVLYSGCFGNVFQVSISIWCVRRKGPVFASIFHPLGVVISIAAGIIILGEALYLGSLVGAVVVVGGFYAVVWGKAKEMNDKEAESNGKTTPLLHHYYTHDHNTSQPQPPPA